MKLYIAIFATLLLAGGSGYLFINNYNKKSPVENSAPSQSNVEVSKPSDDLRSTSTKQSGVQSGNMRPTEDMIIGVWKSEDLKSSHREVFSMEKGQHLYRSYPEGKASVQGAWQLDENGLLTITTENGSYTLRVSFDSSKDRMMYEDEGVLSAYTRVKVFEDSSWLPFSIESIPAQTKLSLQNQVEASIVQKKSDLSKVDVQITSAFSQKGTIGGFPEFIIGSWKGTKEDSWFAYNERGQWKIMVSFDMYDCKELRKLPSHIQNIAGNTLPDARVCE